MKKARATRAFGSSDGRSYGFAGSSFSFERRLPARIASASVMYLPCTVRPYQRSPSRWYTFVSRLTQTMPFDGGA